MINCLPAGLVIQSFVPVHSSVITPGNAARTAVQVRMGQWLESQFKLVSASSFAMGTGPAFYWPTLQYTPYANRINSRGWCYDNSPAGAYPAFQFGSSFVSTGQYMVNNATGTYCAATTITSTIPFTWSTGSDIFSLAARGVAMG